MIYREEIEELDRMIAESDGKNISLCVSFLEDLSKCAKRQLAEKPIEKNMPYSEEVGFNSEWLCPCCNSYIGHFTEGMSEPEQMEYCNVCGQHIARDWSEE